MSLTSCTLQMYIDDAWHDAAAVELTGDAGRGVDASTYMVYLPDYALQYWEQGGAAALSVNLPVDLAGYPTNTWPSFLVDLLPQGYGRVELLKQLGRDQTAGPAADWDLLCSGAGNPIGNIRVGEAHRWAAERSGSATRGFTIDEVAARAGDFNEYFAQHGLFLAGSSGVQGEWPKILLTRAHDGLFYLDHTLADEHAERHFIVKFGRGTDESMANILRLEAPYMLLAKGLGLKVHAELELRERALFIPRFDRQVSQGRVSRLAQESIASLCEIGGFGAAPTHNEVCRRLGMVATDPIGEIVEYLKRDIANIALGNKDNHARNTAIQRTSDGRVTLTPLFDFAPMWLHPDGIARRIRWEADDAGFPNWASAIAQACDAAKVDPSQVIQRVRSMNPALATLLGDAQALGIDLQFLSPLEKSVDDIRNQLEEL
jgi:serine/threonine-protein kinase HipA